MCLSLFCTVNFKFILLRAEINVIFIYQKLFFEGEKTVGRKNLKLSPFPSYPSHLQISLSRPFSSHHLLNMHCYLWCHLYTDLGHLVMD